MTEISHTLFNFDKCFSAHLDCVPFLREWEEVRMRWQLISKQTKMHDML